MGQNTGLLYETETYAILGAAFEVYTTLGCGFLERVYQESLAVEFALREIPFTRHPRLPLCYKDAVLTTHYSPDFLCFEKIVLELKSTGKILSEHRAQLLNYLHGAGTESVYC